LPEASLADLPPSPDVRAVDSISSTPPDDNIPAAQQTAPILTMPHRGSLKSMQHVSAFNGDELQVRTSKRDDVIPAMPQISATPKFPMQRTGAWAISLLAALVVGAGAGYVLHGTQSAPPMKQVDVKPAASELVWLDVLAHGETSPRGQSAANVGADDALKIADAKLHGLEGTSDTEEARFWLRVGLADILSDKRLPWALMQLGTLYAQPPSGVPAFSTARTLWDLAAAKHYPIALCFLAAMEERGLASAPSKARALSLYRQAKAAGGCEAADQAIERLSR
jgi:hypothetical protein